MIRCTDTRRSAAVFRQQQHTPGLELCEDDGQSGRPPQHGVYTTYMQRRNVIAQVTNVIRTTRQNQYEKERLDRRILVDDDMCPDLYLYLYVNL